MNAITIAFIIGVISIICIGIWLMKGSIDFITERNEQYRKDTIKDKQFEIDADGIRCASKSWKISEVSDVK